MPMPKAFEACFCQYVDVMKINVSNLSLLALASAIFVIVMWYAQGLVADLQREESRKMELWADATRLLASEAVNESDVIDMLLKVVRHNTTIPVVVTDTAGNTLHVRNLSSSSDGSAASADSAEVADIIATGNVIDIAIENGLSQRLYYTDSVIIRRLSYFPFVQLGLVVLFVLTAYLLFSRARRSERDNLWMGLSRETAHQLGTPISALLGWAEVIRCGEFDTGMVADEIQADIRRLKQVADRFSKIGSRADMVRKPVANAIGDMLGYLEPRVPKGVTITVADEAGGAEPPHSPTLIAWALENVCRNAVDAMDGKGSITIAVTADPKYVNVDVTDTGHGMSYSTAQQIFDAGFTTKTRGWGIGLALAKRIVSKYHRGKIYVRHTEIGVGTTVRISLLKE